MMWELPAGRIDDGETALTAAKRELLEETGYRARQWKRILHFYVSPGFLDETMTIYLATRLRGRRGPARSGRKNRRQIFHFIGGETDGAPWAHPRRQDDRGILWLAQTALICLIRRELAASPQTGYAPLLRGIPQGTNPGCVIPSLDSPPGEQHNAYTFFAGPWNRAFSGKSARRGGHVER
jgi:ADP-ribose pyrophosphatase YjhB (NUDIX family)